MLEKREREGRTSSFYVLETLEMRYRIGVAPLSPVPPFFFFELLKRDRREKTLPSFPLLLLSLLLWRSCSGEQAQRGRKKQKTSLVVTKDEKEERKMDPDGRMDCPTDRPTLQRPLIQILFFLPSALLLLLLSPPSLFHSTRSDWLKMQA